MEKIYTILFALIFSGLTGKLLVGSQNELTAHTTEKNQEYVIIIYNNHEDLHNTISREITLVEKIQKKYPSPENLSFIEKSKEINQLTASIVSNINRYNDANNQELMSLAEKHRDVAAKISQIMPEVKRLEKKYNDAHRCTIL